MLTQAYAVRLGTIGADPFSSPDIDMLDSVALDSDDLAALEGLWASRQQDAIQAAINMRAAQNR